MSSKMSGAQRRRAEFGIGGTPRTGELVRDDARILNPISYGGQGGDRASNLIEKDIFNLPANIAARAAFRLIFRDRWNATLSAINRRTIFVKAGGWQKTHGEAD